MSKKVSNNKKTGYLQHDLGILALLGSIFFGAVFVANSPSELLLENIVMLLISFSAVMFAAYRFIIPSVVTAGMQIIVYTVHQLFLYYTKGVQIKSMNYVWLFYPFVAVGAAILFVNTSIKAEIENEILKQQVDELVMIDPLTGLYNLKSLYLDLQCQIALALRKKSNITLMIISLRYGTELRKILGKRNFDVLRQRIAVLVQDTLRIEDKVYAIDEGGSLAIILISDEEGAEVVKRRIKSILTSKDTMNGILENRVIRLDFQFAYIQYSEEKFGRDVIRYKQSVESELQYDV